MIEHETVAGGTLRTNRTVVPANVKTAKICPNSTDSLYEMTTFCTCLGLIKGK